MTTTIDLASDARSALAQIRTASADRPVLIFKRSPTCPISHRAEMQFKMFLGDAADADLGVAVIDVIAARDLARGLTSELGIDHESPQALWFEAGNMKWHASHGTLTREAFADLLART
jgi:bacillithiol system protein YtxJ